MNRSAFILLGLFSMLGLEPVAGQPAKGKGDADAIQDVVFLGPAGPLLIRFHIHTEGKPLLAAWSNFVDTVFKHVDKDSDGWLSDTEVKRMPPASVLFGQAARSFYTGLFIQDVVARQPKNPKKVEPAERKYPREQAIKRFFTDEGGTAFRIRGSGSPGRVIYFSPDNGEALTAYGLGGGNNGNDALFTALDTDKDGKLSAKELAAGPALLAKYDLDGNEMIVTGELAPRRQSDYEYLLVGSYLLDAGASAPSWLVAVNRAEKPEVLGQRMLDYYRPTTSDPKKPPQSLKRPDIKLTAAEFARLDKNHDDRLDARELGGFAPRTPDLEFRVEIGRNNQPVFRPLSHGLKTVGTADQRAWLWKQGGLGVVVRLDAPSAEKQKKERQGLLAQMQGTFKELDRDKNGYLDPKEAQGSTLLGGLFAAMDTDKDGQLFAKEMTDYLRPWAEFRDQADASSVSLATSERTIGLFDLLDVNGDARLSVREIRALPKLLAAHDHDKDGRIDKAEFPRTFTLALRPGQGDLGYVDSRDLTLAIALSEDRPPVTAKEPVAGPFWFRTMDRNRDGDVSPREFLGTPAEFQRIDADGDGLITPSEADRFDRESRKP